MPFRSARPHLLSVLLLTLIVSLFPVRAGADAPSELPSLEEFSAAIRNGDAQALRGIYIPELLAAEVVPQPEEDPAFVSSQENTLTQFRMAEEAGSTGLLAHNYLAGDAFFQMEEGQVFFLVYGDGRTEVFVVKRILRFRALDPDSVWSNFIDLRNAHLISASHLFSKVYAQPGHVILQTCIQVGEESSWGRLFIDAVPYPEDLSTEDLE